MLIRALSPAAYRRRGAELLVRVSAPAVGLERYWERLVPALAPELASVKMVPLALSWPALALHWLVPQGPQRLVPALLGPGLPERAVVPHLSGRQ